MGGLFQLSEMLLVAGAILMAILLVAFLVGRFFRDKKIRKRIMVGTVIFYALGFFGYFGWIAFILSGNIN